MGFEGRRASDIGKAFEALHMAIATASREAQENANKHQQVEASRVRVRDDEEVMQDEADKVRALKASRPHQGQETAQESAPTPTTPIAPSPTRWVKASSASATPSRQEERVRSPRRDPTKGTSATSRETGSLADRGGSTSQAASGRSADHGPTVDLNNLPNPRGGGSPLV